MNQKFKLVLGTMCALFCWTCLSNAASGQDLPDGKGKAEFVHNCTVCHGADMVTNVRKTPADWRKTVDDMAARGADGTKEDIDNVYIYVSTNFPLDKSAPTTAAPVAPSSTSSASSTQNGVYTEEQAQQGKAIYTKQCAMCHGDALQGMGPNAPLAGDAFLKKWNGQTMADLFSKTITTMPAIQPGSLTPAQTAQVLSYILAQNKFQSGKTELPTDSQELITIHIK